MYETQSYRVPSFSMSKMKNRIPTVSEGDYHSEVFYDLKEKPAMPDLGKGSVKFEKQSNRHSHSSIYRHVRDRSPEIIDYKAYLNGFEKLGHIKSIKVSPKFNFQLPREKPAKESMKRKVMTLYMLKRPVIKRLS
jgi:hypothetical protein